MTQQSEHCTSRKAYNQQYTFSTTPQWPSYVLRVTQTKLQIKSKGRPPRPKCVKRLWVKIMVCWMIISSPDCHTQKKKSPVPDSWSWLFAWATHYVTQCADRIHHLPLAQFQQWHFIHWDMSDRYKQVYSTASQFCCLSTSWDMNIAAAKSFNSWLLLQPEPAWIILAVLFEKQRQQKR